jgi:methionyl-tRNA formyltransferase
MDLHQLRVVFIGTPDFAVCSLLHLLQAGVNVVAVVTTPDKPSGRGLLVHFSPVKQFAVAHNIPVLQPEKLKAPDFLETLRDFRADLQVVVAFRMLPEAVWNMPPMGTINVHASLLPQYRGAAPINWAIINGETHTGVTTFKLKHEIDTGDILLQDGVTILPDDNAGTLHDKLMHSGAALLVKTIKGMCAETLKEVPQVFDGGVVKTAFKLFRHHQEINWQQEVEVIHNLIRGLAPHPGAFAMMKGKTVKIFKSHTEICVPDVNPGEFVIINGNELKFAALNGWIVVDELQPEGRKVMPTSAFLRGFRQ